MVGPVAVVFAVVLLEDVVVVVVVSVAPVVLLAELALGLSVEKLICAYENFFINTLLSPLSCLYYL